MSKQPGLSRSPSIRVVRVSPCWRAALQETWKRAQVVTVLRRLTRLEHKLGVKLYPNLVYHKEVQQPFWPLHPPRYLLASCFYWRGTALFRAASPIVTSSFRPRSGKEFVAANIVRPARAILPPLGTIPEVRWRTTRPSILGHLANPRPPIKGAPFPGFEPGYLVSGAAVMTIKPQRTELYCTDEENIAMGPMLLGSHT